MGTEFQPGCGLSSGSLLEKQLGNCAVTVADWNSSRLRNSHCAKDKTTFGTPMRGMTTWTESRQPVLTQLLPLCESTHSSWLSLAGTSESKITLEICGSTTRLINWEVSRSGEKTGKSFGRELNNIKKKCPMFRMEYNTMQGSKTVYSATMGWFENRRFKWGNKWLSWD